MLEEKVEPMIFRIQRSIKKGWNFPFLSQEFLLTVGGDDIDVTIENIHIENFNGTCLHNRHGNSVTIRKNRITLESGLGRGLSFGNWGDHVVGITSGGESIDKEASLEAY